MKKEVCPLEIKIPTQTNRGMLWRMINRLSQEIKITKQCESCLFRLLDGCESCNELGVWCLNARLATFGPSSWNPWNLVGLKVKLSTSLHHHHRNLSLESLMLFPLASLSRPHGSQKLNSEKAFSLPTIRSSSTSESSKYAPKFSRELYHRGIILASKCCRSVNYNPIDCKTVYTMATW